MMHTLLYQYCRHVYGQLWSDHDAWPINNSGIITKFFRHRPSMSLFSLQSNYRGFLSVICVLDGDYFTVKYVPLNQWEFSTVFASTTKLSWIVFITSSELLPGIWYLVAVGAKGDIYSSCLSESSVSRKSLWSSADRPRRYRTVPG